jgi:DNA (cytosine-5)-methyltransferase 1
MVKEYTKENPLRVFTAFSGYDSQCLALNRLGITYDLVGWSEIDPAAIKAHDALFPQYADRNYGDISKIDWSQVPDFDLFTYSSPCTDFSNAGAQAGGEEGSGTRSSLLWECRKTILAKKPKYLMFENVKALTSEKFFYLFDKWCKELESYGYANFYQILNAKNYGVPQSRERIFMISILKTDDEPDPYYEFPKPVKLEKCVEDILEDDVPEKYYMKPEVTEKYIDIMNQEYPDEVGEDIDVEDYTGLW